MTTKWIEENWWFPWKDAEEAKVEAFRAWMQNKPVEMRHSDGVWALRASAISNDGCLTWNTTIPMRLLHPHRALIDQYEPGQEWESMLDGCEWAPCVPGFDSFLRYRLKQSAPVVDWTAMPAWAEWVAMDADGWWCTYINEPVTNGRVFDAQGGGGKIPPKFFPKFSGDWKQSKVRRPKA